MKTKICNKGNITIKVEQARQEFINRGYVK